MKGRISPADMFPAGLPDYDVARLRLADGLSVRVVSGGAPADPPVIFLPGWGCSAYSFRRILLPVARAGFRVHCAELRGHGLSDKPVEASQYSTQAMVDHVIAIADALGTERFALVGHSMSGALAGRVAAQVPDRVAALAMISPVGLNGVALFPFAKAITQRIILPILPRFATRWMVRLFLWLAYGQLGDFSRRDVDEYWAPSQFPEYTWALRHLLHEFDWGPESPTLLSAFHAPSLVAYGSRDHLMRDDAEQWFSTALPEGEVRVFREAGHIAPEEVPELVSDALITLLRR